MSRYRWKAAIALAVSVGWRSQSSGMASIVDGTRIWLVWSLAQAAALWMRKTS